MKASDKSREKLKKEIFDEIISAVESKKVKIDSSDIESIISKVQSKIKLPEQKLDSSEIIKGLLDTIATSDDQKRVDFYKDEIFSDTIKTALSKQVLDQIEIPKDGEKGEDGNQGEPGKDAQPLPLTERDKKEIAEFVDISKLIKDRKKDLVLLIKQLKTGEIKLPSHAGIDVKEILAEINKLGSGFNFINLAEDFKGSVPVDPGVLSWNKNELSLNVDTGVGPVLQVGQEIYILICNETGEDIANFTVLRPLGGTVKNGVILPTVELAKADVFSTVEGTLMVSTMDIPNNTIGLATRFGRVRNADTSAFGDGEGLFVSHLVAGEFVNEAPEFPNYAISMGGVLSSDSEDGEFFVSVTRDIFDTTLNFWNGTFRETIDFTVSSSGGVITGTLQPDNGHDDMTMFFSDGLSILDTSPALTIVLTAGTANNPQENLIYIPKSTKVLTLSTSDWPTAEHIKVANVVLRTAAITESDGVLGNRNWNDHIESTTTFQGHLSHIGEKLRQFEAQWDSGAQGTAAGFPSNVYVSTTAGVAYQLHRQTLPAMSMPADDIHVVNNQADQYDTVDNLNTQTLDALGVTLANSSFSFVVWAVQNKTGQASHLMCNLPTGNYGKNTPSSAVTDALNFSVYDIPKLFQGIGFLVARFTFVLEANGTTWSLFDTEDLRGKVPNATAGGGAGGTGVTTLTGLTDYPSVHVASQIPRVNAGGTALDFTTLLPSGATQVAAGVSAGQFWRTASHATLPDNVVMMGV